VDHYVTIANHLLMTSTNLAHEDVVLKWLAKNSLCQKISVLQLGVKFQDLAVTITDMRPEKCHLTKRYFVLFVARGETSKTVAWIGA
jgi:hypothetical protein